MDMISYGYQIKLADLEQASAVAAVTDALKAQGFGVLTEIDVRKTLKKKLDADFRPYTILGACNPHLAHRALAIDAQIGLLLPCNVVVQDDDGGSLVSVINPRAMFSVVQTAGLEAIVAEADERLRAALDSLVTTT